MFGSLAQLVETRRALDAAEAAWLREVAAYDRSGAWRADGYVTPAAALRHACHLNHGVARAHLELARKLEDLPEVADAFAAGEISFRHATVIAHAHTPERAPAMTNVEHELVDLARDHTPVELSRVVQRVTNALDGDGGAADDETEHERRACYTARTLGKTLELQANGDAYNAQIIQSALDAAMVRDHQARDPRRTPQRRFDALVDICRHYLDHGPTTDAHGNQPHITYVMGPADLPGLTPDLVDLIRTERHQQGYLSPAMVELLTCDCNISRVITAGKSEILDVGRSTPTATPAQWKALVARDRHCQAPGCDRPPSQCQAHHLRHWAHGGPTDLDNLILLCWHHHRERHRHDNQTRGRGRAPTYQHDPTPATERPTNARGREPHHTNALAQPSPDQALRAQSAPRR
jgi:hypothetical protein